MAEHLDGATPTEEREDILKRLSRGAVEVVVNCMVLTEGWDSPAVSCVVLARPTKHMGLFRQMVGAGAAPGRGQDRRPGARPRRRCLSAWLRGGAGLLDPGSGRESREPRPGFPGPGSNARTHHLPGMPRGAHGGIALQRLRLAAAGKTKAG